MKDGVPSKDYVDLELMNKQLQDLEQSLQMADQELEYANIAVGMISELKSANPNQELLIPIGNGVFFTVNVGDVRKVKVAVGSGVLVDKTADDAINFVKGQISELNNYRTQSLKLYEQVADKTVELQQKIETGLRNKGN